MSTNGTNNTGQETWIEIERMKLIAFEAQLALAEKYIFIIFAIFTIFGNTLMLLATWKEKILHQPNKYFVACLAVADLLVGMVLEPLRVYQVSVDHVTPIDELCRFAVWIDTFALTASILTLTLISFDRYLKIKKPLQYKSRMTTSKSFKIIFIIWLISTVLASYAATPNSGSWGMLFTSGMFCNYIKLNKEIIFYTFLIIALFFLPAAVILVMYTLIFVVAHKRQKMMRNGELGTTCNGENQRNLFLRDLKIIRMLLVVAGMFILCWGPYFTYLMLFFHNQSFIDWDNPSFSYQRSVDIIQRTILMLAYFSSLCNPIIYACLDQTYRKAFKNLFQRMICRSNHQGRKQRQPETIELQSMTTK